MINVLAYFFKLIFSMILGGVLAYSPSKEFQDSTIVKCAVLSVITAALSGGIIFASPHLQEGLGFGILLMLTFTIYKLDISVLDGIAAISIGMLIGLGHPVFAIIFTITIMFLYRLLNK